MKRCDRCNIESEKDAKYCRKCGRPISNDSGLREEESAAERKTPGEVVESKATSMLDVNFSNPPRAKKVVPLGNARGEGMSRGLRRCLLGTGVSLSFMLLLLLVIGGFMLNKVAHIQRDKERLVSEVAKIQRDKESLTNEVAEITRAKDSLIDQVEDNQRTKDRLDKQIADEQNRLKQLVAQRSVAEGKLKDTETKIASAERTLSTINSNITVARRNLRESKGAIAQLKHQKEKITRELEGLRYEAGLRRREVRNLQRQIDGIRNANHASRKRRSPRRS